MGLRLLLWHICYLLYSRSLVYQVLAFDASPRWGQATVVINDALFIYGGKTDVYNEFSYTSAPNTNDLLYLSLSTPFSASSPPWLLVSSSTNSSTSQGPAVAWGTVSAYNTSQVLLFGGQPGPNSQTVHVDGTDSAELLDVFSRLQPNWIPEPPSWSNEPIRRIRHSATTAPSGLVFVFGGEKADGSMNGLSDHFVFDPTLPSFSHLPSENAPPDIYGHSSIILPDGRILIFGGYSPSRGMLVPLSTLWVLDTTRSNLSWAVINTDTNALPSPRMAFASVLIPGGKILIHGGSDSNLQSNINDGWVLDTMQNPMTWSPVDALSQIGARRDHFAISSGDQVIFGFGYANNGPASAALQIFNPSSGTFSPTFAPPPPSSVTQTLPIPTQTSTQGTQTTFTSTHGINPTSTIDPNHPHGGGDGAPENDNSTISRTTAIAVGASLGVMALLAVCLTVTWYIRKHRRESEGQRQFMVLGEDRDDPGRDSLHLGSQIPIAGMHEVDEHGNRGGLLGTFGIASVFNAARSMRRPHIPRRDMLADEDSRSFGEWYRARQKTGTGNSSWSLFSFFGGTPRLRSREPSTRSYSSGNPTHWKEKSDPFLDGSALMKDEETGYIGAPVRPHARRDVSYTSYVSSRSGRSGGPGSYHDPFVDPIEEELREGFSPTDLYYQHHDPVDREVDTEQPTIRQVIPPSLPPLQTVVPLSQQMDHHLSPLTEHTSRSTLGLPMSASGSSQAHSSDNVPSPFANGGSLSRATSFTSYEPLTPGSPKFTSIIGASDPNVMSTNQPMRRSDSWWSRFSRSSLLDRKSSDAGRSRFVDIRDPNPAPRLGPIEEGSSHSTPGSGSSPGSAERKAQAALTGGASVSRANSARVYTGGHGKSMSSLRTADTEAIERMGTTMDVVQRVKSRTRWSTSSRGSGSTFSDTGSRHEKRTSGEQAPEDLMTFDSPLHESADHPVYKGKGTDPLVSPPSSAGVSIPSGKVSERIQAFERRLSQDQNISQPPKGSRQREERPKKKVDVDYGLVPRPSLFIANPDNREPFYSADSSR